MNIDRAPYQSRQPLRRQLKRFGAIAGAASLVAALLVPFGGTSAEAATPTEYNFTTPGSVTWSVPAGVNTVHITVSGAQGGNERGGTGGIVSGTYDVSNTQNLHLRVAERGGTGAEGGGGDSWGAGGWGYGTGGTGGTGSVSVLVPSVGQGGGGGGGASAVIVGSTAIAVAGGGGGGGGYAVCGGNPGGSAGSPGSKLSNNCASNGGDPGQAGTESGHSGQVGDSAGSSSGQGGGGGGGGGVRGGGGADASTDGGGGGGGGTSSCSLNSCSTSVGKTGNGSIQIRAIHTPVVTFENASYTAITGETLAFKGTVATPTTAGGTPQGTVSLYAENVGGASQQIAAGLPLNAQGQFAYSCTAHCGVDLDGTETIRADYTSNNQEHWTNATGRAGLTFTNAETQTSLFIDPASAVTGQVRDFTATVNVLQPASGAVTGDVEFRMSNVDGSGEEVLGTATLNPSYQATLEAGVPEAVTKRFWAVYIGTSGYNGSQSPKQTLGTDQAETEISASTSPNPTVTGQPFELDADVTVTAPGAGTPTGDITVVSEAGEATATLDGTGSATIPIEGHNAGEVEFSLSYEGDQNFLPSGTTVTHTVDKAEVALGLVIDETESSYGEEVLLTSNASVVAPGEGEITGTVEFGYLDGGAFVSLGDPVALEGEVAEFALSGLDAGEYDFVARYAETDNFLAATSDSVFHTIHASESIVTVTPTPNISTYSMPQQVVITVIGPDYLDDGAPLPAEGEVQLIRVFEDGTEEEFSEALTLDESGAAVVEFGWIDPDTYDVYAVYDGSNNHITGMSEVGSFIVEQAESAVQLSGEKQATIGVEQTFTVDVSAFALFEVPVDGESDSPEEGILPMPAPGEGFPGAGIEPLEQIVQLDFAPTGTIELFVDGTSVAADIELAENTDGSVSALATVTHTFDTVGPLTLTASYGGDQYVMPGDSDPLQVDVSAQPALAVTGAAGAPGVLAASVLLLLVGALSLTRARKRMSH
ncbi:MAG: Ig-like domain-containing protein [Leucobacter sp.]